MTPSAKPSITGPVLLLAACLAMILGAYGFQYIGGFEPCQMCYWQRYAYYTAIPLAALAVFAAAETLGLLARINSFFIECSQPTSSVTVTL